MLSFAKKIVLYPALLLAAGNTALAFGHAEVIGISLNILLVIGILITRIIEVRNNRPLGVPFIILAIVNFITAGSVAHTNITGSEQVIFLDYVAALSYVAWGIGHIFAGYHERRVGAAKHALENPQVFYGIGDMSAVNASGTINPFSFPFMIMGFIKSIFIGKRIKTEQKVIRFIDSELTAARIYGTGFFVGAITSLAIPSFAIAQLLWGLAYFQFKKDTLGVFFELEIRKTPK